MFVGSFCKRGEVCNSEAADEAKAWINALGERAGSAFGSAPFQSISSKFHHPLTCEAWARGYLKTCVNLASFCEKPCRRARRRQQRGRFPEFCEIEVHRARGLQIYAGERAPFIATSSGSD